MGSKLWIKPNLETNVQLRIESKPDSCILKAGKSALQRMEPKLERNVPKAGKNIPLLMESKLEKDVLKAR